MNRMLNTLPHARPRRMIPMLTALAAGILILSVPPRPAQAKIDLVTLPSRDETKITIYNSEDITLVDEKRFITFKKGRNEIQFSWAGTLIDPTSLSIEFMENKGQFDVLDVVYPANTQNLLVWAVESQAEAVVPIKIIYFLSGVTWSADYVMVSAADEKTASLEGYVRVTNNSGEDFENTQVRLVVGTINLVEKIADLARQQGLERNEVMKAAGRAMRENVMEYDAAMPMSSNMPPEIQKEAIGDYFIYTVEGRDDILTGWSKRLKSFSAADVPVEVIYKIDPRETGNAVMKYYRFHNKEEFKLGKEPLPDGLWNVFIERAGDQIFPADYAPLAGRENTAKGLSFLQGVPYKYVPKGEKIDLTLGIDGLITVEERQMSLKRADVNFDTSGYIIGYTETEEWELEARNSKDETVPVELMRWFGGDYDLSSQSSHTKESEQSYKFIVNAKAKDKTLVKYTVTTRKGSNAKK